MRVLITGAKGFVGRYLVAALHRDVGGSGRVLATARAAECDGDSGDVAALDVTDRAAVAALIRSFAPTHVVHLAGITVPAQAECDPSAAWAVNTMGTLAVAEAIGTHAPDCVLLFAGSGLVYGHSALSGAALSEETVLAPANHYAASKAAADLALGAIAGRGLRVVRLRPFNHTGPGQSEDFAVPSFAAQIARIEAGLQPPVVRVGNLDVERDFLDVRDVVAAYLLCLRHADTLPHGQILNIASGIPRRLSAVLGRLLALSPAPIAVEQAPALIRRQDTPRYVGEAGAARRLLGWRPRHDFDDTLAEVLDHQRMITGGRKRFA